MVRSAPLEALGPEAALSKSTASRICQVLKNDFEVFQNRDLTSIDLDYLFLDGSHFKMHDGTNAEPVMVAYAITTVGQPVLVAVEPAAAESTDAWADLLAGLTRRGLTVALLTITDGAAGLINAIGTQLHGSLPHPSGQKRTRQNPHQSSTNNQRRVLDHLR